MNKWSVSKLKVLAVRSAAGLAVVMWGATMAAAQSWTEEVTKDKFGDVDGRLYTQVVTAEVKNKHPNVSSSKWNLAITDAGDNRVVIMVVPSPSFLGLIESLPVRISLRDGNGKVQTFEGRTLPSASSSSTLGVGSDDINFAKALEVKTKFKIVLEGAYPGDDWLARADIVGNSPGAKIRTQRENEKKMEKAKAEEEERVREEAAKKSITIFVDSRDNKEYKKITIGNQTWMAENLNYDVPNNTSDVCYENNADNCDKYGRLYTWKTAIVACPVGWHLPSSSEWRTLTEYVGGYNVAGKKLKSTSGWANNGNGTDEFGFSALPGTSGERGEWWNTTQFVYDSYGYYAINYNEQFMSGNSTDKTSLFSVRCVEGDTEEQTRARQEAEQERAIMLEQERARQEQERARQEQERARLEAERQERANKQSAKASITTFVDKRDKKTYKKVTIGGQTWMAENLNYKVGKSMCYDWKKENCDKGYGDKGYGRLYDWYAAMKACPAGWHLPSDAEWTTLTDYVGGEKTAGIKLKSTTINGTNEYGFSALPGGYGATGRNIIGVSSRDAGYYGSWWSATEYGTLNAWSRSMKYGNESVGRDSENKTYRYSVRCVQD